MITMATFTSNISESTVVSLDGNNRAPPVGCEYMVTIRCHYPPSDRQQAAGWANLFEQQFTAQKVHRYKPARETTEIEQLLRDFAVRFPMLHVLSSTVNGLTHGGVSTV
jgi:hypothetical protein